MQTTSRLIAVVDDEPDILELVRLHLQRSSFQVQTFENAVPFLDFVQATKPDLVILDIMLPDADGLEVCKFLRGNPSLAAVPIIMLTARGDETDKILGLELGADDYVTKPFSPRELVARVKAVLRRKQEDIPESSQRIGGDLILDPGKHQVILQGKNLPLTLTEFRILQLLATKPGWVYTRDQILDHLWGQEKAVVDRTIDVHIKHLREKLGTASHLIKNVRGVGYKLEE